MKTNPVEIGHPVLEMDPSVDQPPSLVKIASDCEDILQAILDHHTINKERNKYKKSLQIESES
jgi:hypothetical protein